MFKPLRKPLPSGPLPDPSLLPIVHGYMHVVDRENTITVPPFTDAQKALVEVLLHHATQDGARVALESFRQRAKRPVAVG